MYGLTGPVISCATRLSICGWSYLTASFSERSTETTIIAAVGFGRRPALAALPASHADSTRVCGRLASVGHEVRALAVELGLRALEQDRHELGGPELGVGQLLGA